MAAKAQMVRWGNSLAVRMPKNVAEEAALSEGDDLVLTVKAKGTVEIKAADRPTLEDLVSRITAENLHRETDWGGVVGAETW